MTTGDDDDDVRATEASRNVTIAVFIAASLATRGGNRTILYGYCFYHYRLV